MKTIVVLGATGNLGAEVASYLCAHGYGVIAVGHRPSDNGFFKKCNAEYIGDFSLENSADFGRLPNGIDAVVHLAGKMAAHAGCFPMPYIQSIIVGMINVCEWMKKKNINRIIFNTTPSDVAQYFGSNIAVKEDSLRSFPQDGGDHAIYAISKNTAVDILTYYQKVTDILPCVFRHMTVYGWHPNATYYLNGEKKILPFRQIIRKCIRGDAVEVWGDPLRKKELLYIKDFARAVLLAVESNACGLMNLPGCRPYTLEEQIDGLIKGFSPTERHSPKVYMPEKANTPQNLLAMGRAKTELHWLPQYKWEDACIAMRRDLEVQPFKLLWGENSPEDSYVV